MPVCSGRRDRRALSLGVGLVAVEVTGTDAVGGLAGRNGRRVTGCWATGRVFFDRRLSRQELAPRASPLPQRPAARGAERHRRR